MLSRKRKSPGIFSLALRLLLTVGLACAALTAGTRLIGQRQPSSVVTYTFGQRSGGGELYAVDVARGNIFDLTNRIIGSKEHGVWSADGTRLAYQRVVTAVSQICVISRQNFCYEPTSSGDRLPLLSPDGRWLAFLDFKPNMTLFVRSLDQGMLWQYGDPNTMQIANPAWSPDSTQIAYIQSPSSAFTPTGLYVAHADLTDPHPLLAGGGLRPSAPVWSPNGEQIAFIAEHGLLFDVYVIDISGGKPRQVTHSGRESYPTWSPDGRQIAYISSRDGDLELFVIDADGTNERQLTHNDALDEIPVWSPDGKRLAFISQRDGGYNVYVIDVATAVEQRVTFDGAYNFDPAWMP